MNFTPRLPHPLCSAVQRPSLYAIMRSANLSLPFNILLVLSFLSFLSLHCLACLPVSFFGPRYPALFCPGFFAVLFTALPCLSLSQLYSPIPSCLSLPFPELHSSVLTFTVPLYSSLSCPLFPVLPCTSVHYSALVQYLSSHVCIIYSSLSFTVLVLIITFTRNLRATNLF
jgi:hypothetical protein